MLSGCGRTPIATSENAEVSSTSPCSPMHLGAKQQAGIVVGPEAITVAVGVAGAAPPERSPRARRRDRLPSACTSYHSPMPSSPRLQQRRKRVEQPTLLDHRDVARWPERVDDVVVTKDLALAAVERLDPLVLVRPVVEMGDARAGDAAAAAHDEGALEIAMARRIVDAQQPATNLARGAAEPTQPALQPHAVAPPQQRRDAERQRDERRDSRTATRPLVSGRRTRPWRCAGTPTARRAPSCRELLVRGEVAVEPGIADQPAVIGDGHRRRQVASGDAATRLAAVDCGRRRDAATVAGSAR